MNRSPSDSANHWSVVPVTNVISYQHLIANLNGNVRAGGIDMSKQNTSTESKVLRDLGRFQITRDEVHFSELEERVLAAYDELEELRLERCLLENSQRITRGTCDTQEAHFVPLL